MTTTINVDRAPSIRTALRWKRNQTDPAVRNGPSFRARKVHARGDEIKVVQNKSDGSSTVLTIK